MLDFVRQHFPPDAVIAAQTPDGIYLASGYQSVPLTEDSDARFLRLERMDALAKWIQLSGKRPFLLYSTCPVHVTNYYGHDFREVDIPGNRVALILKQPTWRFDEVFRSADCKQWIGVLRR